MNFIIIRVGRRKHFNGSGRIRKKNALILASPQTGLLIPAHTGRKVIYGHPYETVYAAEEEKNIVELFTGKWQEERALQYLKDRQVKFIFWGPQEQKYGKINYINQLPIVYQEDNVVIYSVD